MNPICKSRYRRDREEIILPHVLPVLAVVETVETVMFGLFGDANVWGEFLLLRIADLVQDDEKLAEETVPAVIDPNSEASRSVSPSFSACFFPN